jgi:Fe2+ or Zn2+ uptake regulation protein
MAADKDIMDALGLCGFISGKKQESRLLNILSMILKLQTNPPIALSFSEIYEQIEREDPSASLTKAWVHKVLKALIDVRLIRVDNPAAHRKRYIADANTVMAGLEKIKSHRVKELEVEIQTTRETLEKVNALECGRLAQEFVKKITGQQQVVSSRVVRGVEELHRVLRYNMLDIAKRGDIIRATLLWVGPWIDSTTRERLLRFFEAAERGVEVRYLVSSDFFKLEDDKIKKANLAGLMDLFQKANEMRARGKKFDARFYFGPKTYNQISLNRDCMALVITENPVTATYITKQFNPDLIDNAVKSFDKDWKQSKSAFELTQEDMAAIGIIPGGIMSRLVNSKSEEGQNND